ncbi:MAG TPA: LpqB family beta-propeller domain-containing protein, partial [Acidimicrobiales bacterium]|nr:LpqB family beta-propeller domain-containing protein [Acidimicrobiales bacterium]
CDLNLAGDPTAAVVGVRKIAADFAIDPFWLDTGNHVSWIEWDIPNMPWMASRLVSARADGTGPVDNIVSSESTSVSQASLSPDGTHLAFICDQTGWPVVWVADADGSNSRPLCDTEGVEHSEPTWGPGQRSWCWSPDSRSIAFGRNAGGFWSLHVATIDEAEGAALPRQIGNGFHAGVNWSASGIISLSSPHGIVKMAGNHEGMISSMPLIDPLNCKVLARGLVGGFEPSMMGNCEAVSWNSKGKDIHGRLYRGAIERDEENPSPVLIWIHGGPMGQMGDLFNPRIAFFLERGWSVLVPDFRGSSGWGRDYSAGLDEMWGVADVDDVAAGMEYVAKTDWADRQLMVPIGASSGGTCVLLLMARYPQLCAAGIDLYGVTDFLDLTLHTHRFEKHYNESLIGALPGSEQRYRDRSPISQAQNICSPILVLHGDRDKVVPIEQSVELVSTIRESGGQVSFHVYEGQGHGWSDPSTVADELARIEEFLESVR